MQQRKDEPMSPTDDQSPRVVLERLIQSLGVQQDAPASDPTLGMTDSLQSSYLSFGVFDSITVTHCRKLSNGINDMEGQDDPKHGSGQVKRNRCGVRRGQHLKDVAFEGSQSVKMTMPNTGSGGNVSQGKEGIK
jgi:hypothetical protein